MNAPLVALGLFVGIAVACQFGPECYHKMTGYPMSLADAIKSEEKKKEQKKRR